MQKTDFFGQTDMGQIRKNNEDNLIYQNIWDKNHVLGVAIDGVGGYEGGEVAAEIAKDTIVEYLEKYFNGDRIMLLTQAVTEANNRIVEERQKQPNLSQMSCVLTAVLVEVSEKRINMVHIGDSRFYQFHNNILEKLSHDHSYVGYKEDNNYLTEEEAMNHPKRNEINRMLGDKMHQTDDADFIEAKTFPLLPNSILLLCSDGLTDLVTKAEMSEILSQKIDLKEKTQLLIAKANAKGGKDNITVVLIDYQSDEIIANVKNIEDTIVGIENIKNQKTEKHKSKIIIVGILALLLGLSGGWFGKTYCPVENKPTAPVDSVKTKIIKVENWQTDSLDLTDTDAVEQYIQSLNDTIAVREQKLEKIKLTITE